MPRATPSYPRLYSCGRTLQKQAQEIPILGAAFHTGDRSAAITHLGKSTFKLIGGLIGMQLAMPLMMAQESKSSKVEPLFIMAAAMAAGSTLGAWVWNGLAGIATGTANRCQTTRESDHDYQHMEEGGALALRSPVHS
jgi:hypothetical protein